MKEFFIKYSILFLSLIMAAGFFLSYIAFKLSGGDATTQDYLSPAALVALIVIVLTFGGAIAFYNWLFR